MLSRRLFLLSAMGLVLYPQTAADVDARPRRAPPVKAGARSLARQDWPPAIVPDHVAVVDRGYVCVTDEFGRLALADLKRPDTARVVGELSQVGKKIVDFAPAGPKAYALALQELTSGDSQYVLAGVSLKPAGEPSLISDTPLDQFSEPTCLTVQQDLICVGGVSFSGDNLVAIYRRNKSGSPALVSTVSIEGSVLRLDLQDRHLVVLSSGRATQIDYLSLLYPQSPHLRKSIKLEGDYRSLARFKGNLFVAGQAAGKREFEVKVMQLEPAPHAVASLPLGNITAVLDAAAQKERFFVLVERGPQQQVKTFAISKNLDVTPEQTIELPAGKATPGLTSRLAAQDRAAYVACGWEGIQVLSFTKLGWQHAFTYAIPRLAASSVAVWGDLVALAAADLKVYNIARPDKPQLVASADPGQPIRSISGAGSYILCLGKTHLTLRKMDNPNAVNAALAVSAQHMAFDKQSHKAYLIDRQEKKTVISCVRVYSDSLTVDKKIDLPAGYRYIAAGDNQLLVGGVNDVSLYSLKSGLELVGSRRFDNLAVRDLKIASDYLAVAAVDGSSKGFLLVLPKDEKELVPLGAVDLPQDAAAIAASGDKAVVVGRSPDGKDMASIVSLAQPAAPRLVASFPVVDSASAVTIKDSLAIVVGRGLEILSLS